MPSVGIPISRANRRISRLIRAADEAHGEAIPQAEWTAERARYYRSVSVPDLLSDPEFFGSVGGGELWPVHRADVVELFERREKEGFYEFYDETGIGGGKTTKAAAITAIMLYQAMTDWDFRARFSLMRTSEVVLLMGSRNEWQSSEITFGRFLPFCTSPFFRKYFPPNYRLDEFDPDKGGRKRYPKSIRFPGHFYVFPITRNILDTLGWDILCATLDEGNFLEFIVGSKRTLDEGQSTYDAAELFHGEAGARIKSRFTYKDRVYGQLTIISSKRFTNSFVSRKIRAIQRAVRTDPLYTATAMWRSRCSWEPQPSSKVSSRYVVVNRRTGDIIGHGTAGDGRFPEAESYGIWN